MSTSSVTIREGILELPSYPIDPPEKSPVFDCKWCYQRARRSIYPYPLNDNVYEREPKLQAWKALYLENEYVEACVLPEIGGRLFYAIDKTNGYDIFYHQDVIKPACIAMNGAWISGGVEWNAFHHHRISTHMPCDWRLVENADGSKTIWLGETERRHRMSWVIGITLRPGSSVLEIDGRLINGTDDTNSFLFWANAATHANENYQIIFPQNTEFAAFHAKDSICHWPISTEPFNGTAEYANHIDVSWWKNHPCGNSLFAFELPEDFIGGYDYGKDAGTMLVGNRHIIRGGKFWSWGPKSGWPTNILTDKSGHYVELMVGAYSDSQPDYTWIGPGESKGFHMAWYGVRNLHGIKMGNELAAMNMEPASDGAELLLAVNGTRPQEGLRVRVLRHGADVVFEQVISVAPDAPWSCTIPMPKNAKETDLTMQLFDATSRLMLTYTPMYHDPKKPCPPEVQRPKRPREIRSIEECYFVGLRAEQFHNPYVEPTDYYAEVLRRDPLDSRANTRMGVLARKRWDFEAAERYLRDALERPTASYTRVKDGEALYNLGLVLLETGRVPEAIDALFRASWTYEYNAAANLALARIYVSLGEPARAHACLDEAIDHNARLLDAKCLKAALLRMADCKDAALALLDNVLGYDPIHAFATREKALLLGTPEADAAFDALMRDDPESYLELSLKYKASGLTAEATELLERIDARVAYPTVKLHLQKIDEFLAMDIGVCHPFRLETANALTALTETHSNEAKIWYLLGNCYGNRDPLKAIKLWKQCLACNPKDAYALRNIGYMEWKWTKDFGAALTFYRKAIEAKPDAAYFLAEFAHVAQESKLPPKECYAILKEHHAAARTRSDSLTAECVFGILSGDYEYVVSLMRTEYFPTYEGADNFHEHYVDALLLQGEALLAAGDAAGALAHFQECFEYPVSHQVFPESPHSHRDAQIWHAMARAYAGLGNIEKATEYYILSAEANVDGPFAYWKGLSLLQVGRRSLAQKLAQRLVDEGSKPVAEHIEFFGPEGNHFGKAIEIKRAERAFLKGVGELLQGKKEEARADLDACRALRSTHLWARILRP